MRTPLQVQILTEPDPKATAAAGEPRVRPRLHVVTLPASHADRQDLVVSYFASKERDGMARARVYAAAIGLTTRIGRESGVTFGGCDCNVFVYGGKVFDYLHAQGVEPAHIGTAGGAILDRIFEVLAPSADEVKAAEGNSEAGAAPATS